MFLSDSGARLKVYEQIKAPVPLGIGAFYTKRADVGQVPDGGSALKSGTS